ncbi:MAG: 1-acyl-sn-glycerol-3-phosphate acyltransferase, partial [Flavobacteriaceae bacterium]
MGNLLSRFIYFSLLRWKLEGRFPDLPKYVVAVVPHTSWLDFFIGLMVRSISKEQINFLGKKELFTPYTSWFFKGLGGAPLDRSGNKGAVDAIVQAFDSHQKFRIALAPEGTRKKVEQLKTGYYHIAKKLEIPIVPVAFDYKNKKVIIHAVFRPT